MSATAMSATTIPGATADSTNPTNPATDPGTTGGRR